jgi:hypothetical protein
MIQRFLQAAALPIALLWLSVAAVAQTTTFNTSDSTKLVTFSNGNLTITRASGAGGEGGARAADPQTAGKFYFECKLAVQANTDTSCGIASDLTYMVAAGAASNRAELVFKSGNVWTAGSNTGKNIGAPGTSDWIGVAVDLDNSKIWFRKNAGNWNGDVSANPATNTGGVSIPVSASSTLNTGTATVATPVYPVGIMASVGDQVVANFGATAFAQTVPSGFTSGWTTNTITSVAGWMPNGCAAMSFSGSQSLVATRTGSSSGCQPSYMRNAGKYFVSFKVNTLTGAGDVGIGLVTGQLTWTTFGNNTDSISYRSSTGNVVLNSSTLATYSTFTTGDVIDEAIDFDNNTIWFRKNGGNWNGSVSNDPATNVGGLDITTLVKPAKPAIAIGTTNNDNVTANFGYYHFTYTAPSGFVAGWPINGPQYTLPTAAAGSIPVSPRTMTR